MATNFTAEFPQPVRCTHSTRGAIGHDIADASSLTVANLGIRVSGQRA